MKSGSCETLSRCKRRMSRMREANAVVEEAIFRAGDSAASCVDQDVTRHLTSTSSFPSSKICFLMYSRTVRGESAGGDTDL